MLSLTYSRIYPVTYCFTDAWNEVTFEWPASGERTIAVTNRELRWLLDGLSLTQRQVVAAGRSAESQSYLWLYRTGWMGPPVVLYDYQTTRGGEHPLLVRGRLFRLPQSAKRNTRRMLGAFTAQVRRGHEGAASW